MAALGWSLGPVRVGQEGLFMQAMEASTWHCVGFGFGFEGLRMRSSRPTGLDLDGTPCGKIHWKLLLLKLHIYRVRFKMHEVNARGHAV
jgi:hypothetical protein